MLPVSIVSGMRLVSGNPIYRRTSITARYSAAEGALASGYFGLGLSDLTELAPFKSRPKPADAPGRPARWNLERRTSIRTRKERFKTLNLRIVRSEIRFRFSGRCVNVASRLSCEAVAALHQQEASCDIHTTRKSTRR